MLKLQYFGHLMQKVNSLGKEKTNKQTNNNLMLGKIKGKRQRVVEDEMVR